MTSKDVKHIEEYIRKNDSRRAIRYIFTCEHRNRGLLFNPVMTYVFVCHGPILGRTDDVKEAIDLIDTCSAVSR